MLLKLHHAFDSHFTVHSHLDHYYNSTLAKTHLMFKP